MLAISLSSLIQSTDTHGSMPCLSDAWQLWCVPLPAAILLCWLTDGALVPEAGLETLEMSLPSWQC